MYSAKHWTQDAILRMGREYDLRVLRNEAAWVRDYKVADWCDAALASLVAKEVARKAAKEQRNANMRKRQQRQALVERERLASGLIPEVRDVIAHERMKECGLVDVREHKRAVWVRKA